MWLILKKFNEPVITKASRWLVGQQWSPFFSPDKAFKRYILKSIIKIVVCMWNWLLKTVSDPKLIVDQKYDFLRIKTFVLNISKLKLYFNTDSYW